MLEDYLAAAHKTEYSLSDLRVAEPSRTYASPSGILLNATYIDCAVARSQSRSPTCRMMVTNRGSDAMALNGGYSVICANSTA